MANIETPDAPEKSKVADHYWLGPDGDVVKNIADAVGIRYAPTDKSGDFDYLIPGASAGSPQTMGSVFGYRTLAINTASRRRQALRKGEDFPFATDKETLEDRFSRITEGDWGAAEGGGGFAYDLDKLADALVEVLTAKRKGSNRDKIRAAMDAGGTIAGTAHDAKGYVKTVVGMEGVRDAYDRLRGKGTVSIKDAADDFA